MGCGRPPYEPAASSPTRRPLLALALALARPQAQLHLEPGQDYTADLELPGSDCGRLQLLKRHLLRLEAALPAEAVDEAFPR